LDTYKRGRERSREKREGVRGGESLELCLQVGIRLPEEVTAVQNFGVGGIEIRPQFVISRDLEW